MMDIWNNLMEHPALTLFCVLCLLTWAAIEIWRAIFPMKDARRHWGRNSEFGFKAVDRDELFRRCEGDQ